MGYCHHKEQDLPLCSLIRALMCTMEDVPTAAPAVHNVKDTMEDAPINTDMSRSPFCPPSSPIDVVPIVAVEFFMAAPNSQYAFGVIGGAERFSFGFLNTTKEVTMEVEPILKHVTRKG
ncbi:hypothetical protein U9M48_027798 [Paspalum notatum var. saurae]|uniref:Uncharacterized protein n=1 Tax=Paspalum notatum var. saurae TaxID=547442 RepID=A0AAQ3WZR9_PASNO